MTHRITLIPGDGIGPEVTGATVRILEATGIKFEWETYEAGAEAYEKYHEYIPKDLITSIERTKVALKGPVTTPIGGGASPVSMLSCAKDLSSTRTFGLFEICPTFLRAIPMSTSLSFGKIPRACTQASNTRLSPE